LSAFSQAVEQLERAFAAIGEVTGDDGRSLVEAQGAEPRGCMAWREVLSKIDEELIFWGRTFKRVFGTTAEPSSNAIDSREDGGDWSERKDAGNESPDEWDNPEQRQTGQVAG